MIKDKGFIYFSFTIYFYIKVRVIKGFETIAILIEEAAKYAIITINSFNQVKDILIWLKK